MNLSRNVTKLPCKEIVIEEETFPAAEKILSDIENVIKKDLELSSFEIIPIGNNENRSPVYHEERSLGLASWCIRPLYRYVHTRLANRRKRERRRDESLKIARWSMGALLLNPENGTFWNTRRELVRSGNLEVLGELRFAAAVLFRKAKCFEAFAYRRWLLQRLLADGEGNDRETENLLCNEFDVAEASADRCASNYHAWTHREHILAICEKSLPKIYGNLLKREWMNSGKWCRRHVSDHSGLSYRQFLLNRLLFEEERSGARRDAVSDDELAERRRIIVHGLMSSSTPIVDKSRQLLKILHGAAAPGRSNDADHDHDRSLIALSYWAEECKSNENDILRFPGHEALWYHRRFLGHALARLAVSYKKHGRYCELDRCGDDNENAEGEENERNNDTDCDNATDRTSVNGKQEGLLTHVFHRDNERIVRISLNSKNEPQASLSEKFVKYMREFGLD